MNMVFKLIMGYFASSSIKEIFDGDGFGSGEGKNIAGIPITYIIVGVIAYMYTNKKY